MRQKELRIALVCYGGVSLAVYMHGVTKEIWKLARASRAFHAAQREEVTGVEAVYLSMLQRIERERDLRLRVLPDIITGASAGGINAVFLAQAVHSGRSLEPLTKLWLETADVEQLVHPEARPWSPAARVYMRPIVWYLTRAPGNTVSETVAADMPESRIAERLAAIQDAHPHTLIGSYPRATDGRFTTQIVVRSRDEALLRAAVREVAEAVAEISG